MVNIVEIFGIFFPYVFLFREGNLLSGLWILALHIAAVSFIILFIKKTKNFSQLTNDILIDFSRDKIEKDPFVNAHWQQYSHNFVSIEGRVKSLDFAEAFFNEHTLQQSINLRFWRNVPALFVGFGILGTFFGLTYGLRDFDPDTSESITSSIGLLMGGISTAFLTSLHGIALSLIFGIIEKKQFHSFGKNLQELCTFFDLRYKLTRQEERQWKKDEQKDLVDQALSVFTTKDDEGNDLLPGHLLRDLLFESKQHTSSLKAFSVDLADSLKVLADSVEEKVSGIVAEDLKPMLEKIQAALVSLESSMKSLTSEAGDSIGKELAGAVNELKDQLKIIVDDFRKTFSEDVLQQIQQVVESLDKSIKLMAKVPDFIKKNLNNISKEHYEEAQKRQQKMAEEFEDVLAKFKNGSDAIRENMNNHLDQENKLIEHMDKMIDMVAVSKDNFQELLSATQETIAEEKGLLHQFSQQNENSRAVSDNIQKASESLQATSTQVLSVADKLNTSASFLDNQIESSTMAQMKFSAEIKGALEKNQENLRDYVSKFQIIEKGLSEVLNDIFREIGEGLNKFSNQIREDVNHSIGSSIESLTDISAKLAGSLMPIREFCESIEDLLEVLWDLLDKIQRKT